MQHSDRFRRLFQTFRPPIFDDEEKTRSAQILNAFGWATLPLIILLALSRFLVDGDLFDTTVLILSILCVSLLVMQALVRFGYVRIAAWLIMCISWVAMTYQAWHAEGVRDIAVVAYLIIIMAASLLLGWQESAFFLSLSVAAIWALAVLEQKFQQPWQLQDNAYEAARDLTVIFLLAFVLIYLLISSLRRLLVASRLELRERLRAEERIQRQTQYLIALHETTLSLMDRLELRPLLESILIRACQLIRTPHGCLDMVLPNESAMRQEFSRGIFEKFHGMLSYKGRGIAGMVWSTGKSMMVQNYPEWDNNVAECVQAGVRAVVSVPLMSGTNVIGALALAYDKEGDFFSDEQRSLLERFAALASLAIDNARLYERNQVELIERRLAEAALRSSQERFRQVFHISPVGIMISDMNSGQIIEVNYAYLRIRKMALQNVLGRTTLELGFWKNEGSRNEFVAQLRKDHSMTLPDSEIVSSTGEKRIVTAFYETVWLGERECILTMLQDITEQKRAQGALAQSEERFRKVFTTDQIAISIVTLEEGRFLDANDAFWKLSGVPAEKGIGRTALEMGFWDQAEDRENFVKELTEKHSLQNVDVEFRSDAGPTRSTLGFYELIHIEDQLCILCMFHDVTEQKKAEQALRQNEARIRTLLNAIPDMIFEMSRDGTFISYVPSPEIPVFLPPDEFLGKNIKDVMPPDVSSQAVFAVERAIDTGQLHAFEYQLDMDGRKNAYEARVVPGGPYQAVVMVRNITLRKWAEAERESMIDELESKNAELERFTYTVSHDLKSPLITIKGFLGFLEQDMVAGNVTRLKSDIKRIGDATDKMQRLLNDLLELSRVGRLKNASELISFETLAQEAVELVQGRIMAAGIKTSVQSDMPNVYGDHPRLLEVVQNLVDNAAKFMGKQPEPCIEIGCMGEEDNGRMAIFFVRDNGVGIAPEHHDRIFGLFNKLDAMSEGTGVGLALVKRIIDIHGGRIWVESEAEKGTTFYFTLPARPSD